MTFVDDDRITKLSGRRARDCSSLSERLSFQPPLEVFSQRLVSRAADGRLLHCVA